MKKKRDTYQLDTISMSKKMSFIKNCQEKVSLCISTQRLNFKAANFYEGFDKDHLERSYICNSAGCSNVKLNKVSHYSCLNYWHKQTV